MDHMLHFVLVLVAVALAGFLVPLLIQLHRTAKAVEALAISARVDLQKIAQDVHQASLQIEKVASLAEQSLAFPATASSIAAGLARSMGTLLEGKASLWVEALVTALKLGMEYFRRPREAPFAKEKNDE